jgi:hypothetical protein
VCKDEINKREGEKMDETLALFTEEEQQELGLDVVLYDSEVVVSTLEQASRYAYGVSATREDIATIQSTADAEIARWQAKIDQVTAWRDAEVAKLNRKKEYLEGKLLAYHVAQFHSAPNEKAQAKLKSIKLPYGVTLKSKQTNVGLEVKADEESKKAYEAYMTSNGLTEPQPPKLKWGEAKAKFKIDDQGRVSDENGEAIDFLKVIPSQRNFVVE